MVNSSVRYLKLLPTRDSRLSIDDSKDLIAGLSETSSGQFELIIKSTSASGVELLIGSRDPGSIKKQIYAISPDLSVEEVSRRSVSLNQPNISRSYVFSRHYAYPLYYSSDPADDAFSGFVRSISQLEDKQTLLIKLTAKEVRPLKAWLLRNRLIRGATPKLHDPGAFGQLKRLLWFLAVSLVFVVRTMLYAISNLIYSRPTYSIHSKPNKIVSPRNVMLLDKLYEPLFKTSLEVDIKASSKKSASKLAEQMQKSINNYGQKTGYQQFKVSKPGLKDLYSLSDLAACYHMDQTALKEGLYRIQSFKALPLSPELNKQKLAGDLLLGFNSYQGLSKDIILPKAARERHLYITGATGSGKSTLLANLILQDLNSGQGLSLIDPHGDLAAEVFERVPKERLKDVIYFDPSDPKSKLSINLLDIAAKPGSTAWYQEADQVTESIISLFRKIFSDSDSGGHRVEYILRNAIHTALKVPNANIFTIFHLLTDANYRLKVIPTIKDQNLVNFWRNELGRAGEYQRVKMSAGVTAKIGRFLFSEPSKRVFGQTISTFDARKLLDERKILICNFAKGKLGEDGSRLFSAAMLTELQLAALARVNSGPEDRPEHYLYVDEFQNHAPSTIVQMLSEARKYGLLLTMAEQSPYQQDSQATKTIMANIGNLLCFRTALPKDEALILPNFDKYLSATDLNELPAYRFYFKSTGLEAIPPTSGQTYPLTLVTAVDNMTSNISSHKSNIRLNKASQPV